MRVLVGCEQSQIVTEAFIKLGHDAMSCDINYDGAKGLPHYRGDVRDLFDDYWDIFICHPECTRLCNSGVRWLAERDLWKDMRKAARFFRTCLNAPIKSKMFGRAKKIVENPIMHKYALKIVGRKHDQIIQPWMFGDYETKATCLWLDGIDPLSPIYKTKEECAKELGLSGKPSDRIHKMAPGPERSRMRSETYPGIAMAFARHCEAL